MMYWKYIACFLFPLFFLTLAGGAWFLWTRSRTSQTTTALPAAVAPTGETSVRDAATPQSSELKMPATKAEEACKRGDAAVERKDRDLAINEYTEAIRLDPKCARAYSGRGLA